MVKNLPANAGDTRDLRRSTGEGHGYPLHYFRLVRSHAQRNLKGYSPWCRKESDTTEWLIQSLSLMTYDVEHLFICLHAICIFTLVRCLLGLWLFFYLGRLFSYCWFLRVLLTLWLTVLYEISFAKIFFQLRFVFSFLQVVFHRAKANATLMLMNSNWSICLSWIVPFVLYLKSYCHAWVHLDFLLLSSKPTIILHFTFRTMIHFEWSFVKGVKSVSRFVFLHRDIKSLLMKWKRRVKKLA